MYFFTSIIEDVQSTILQNIPQGFQFMLYCSRIFQNVFARAFKNISEFLTVPQNSLERSVFLQHIPEGLKLYQNVLEHIRMIHILQNISDSIILSQNFLEYFRIFPNRDQWLRPYMFKNNFFKQEKFLVFLTTRDQLPPRIQGIIWQST